MAVKDESVVLAHGARAEGSSWVGVIAALKKESAEVSAAPLPVTSLANDMAALNRSLDRTDGAIVLAGHAYPARRSLRAGRICGSAGRASCRAAADVGELHHCSCPAPSLEYEPSWF